MIAWWIAQHFVSWYEWVIVLQVMAPWVVEKICK